MKTFKKYPIGIQSFEKLIEDSYLYVDKTALIYNMIQSGTIFFFSRPRRFGKSLLVSTLEAYFLGKKDLFKGLAMEQLETEWLEYPVLHLDFSGRNYENKESLLAHLNMYLEKWEKLYGNEKRDFSAEERFRYVIENAFEQTGKRVVVLIDEYDKPMLEAIGNKELMEAYRNILRGFYGVLKPADQYLKFTLLTGVTKFGQMSVFSDLNQLEDISMSSTYDTLCGITEEEIFQYFDDDIRAMAEKFETSYEDVIDKLRRQYDGYHFSKANKGVYNPFSLLNVFKQKEFSNYWFQTGTPTYLLKLLKRNNYDITSLEGIKLSADEFADYRAEIEKPIPMIYQSGYLTIKDYDPIINEYTLGFPNEEVRGGFLRFIAPSYIPLIGNTGLSASDFIRDLYANNVEGFMTRFKSFVASIDYELFDDKLKERYFQIIFYLVFSLAGAEVSPKVHTSDGRMDAVIKTPSNIYIFEFKLDKSAEEAMEQIELKHYPDRYLSDSRDIVKIGANFKSETRSLDKWVIA